MQLVWNYIGNCVNLFDEDGNCVSSIFRDVSDFACKLESSIDCQKPKSIVIPPSVKCDSFQITEDKSILIGYDENNDIHSFFILSPF